MENIMKLMFAIALPILAGTALAEEEVEEHDFLGGDFSTWVNMATDYVFRGESETNDGQVPAIQGDYTWTHKSGFYVGVFGSTNKFKSAPDIYAVIGPYVGISGGVFDTGFDYNVFIYHYHYPGATRFDYTELWMYLSRQFGKFNMLLEVTPTLNDWFGVTGTKAINYAGHPSYELPYGINLSGTFGYQWFDDPEKSGVDNWYHWNIGVSKTWEDWKADLRYHDTDLPGRLDPAGIFDSRVVFGVSRTF